MASIATAQHMVGLLQQLAQQQSNPLLLLLPRNAPVIEQHKYPETPLDFNGQPLRAYYHCHPAEQRRDNEHGHFHLFVPSQDNSGWSHLAALAMDDYGQPLAWFCVNRWVTAGSWESPRYLLQQLDRLVFDSQTSLVEQWLLGMLQLYRQELEGLLQARDEYLARLEQPENVEERLEARAVYQLSACDIVLLDKLQSLLPTPAAAPAYG